MREKLLKWKYKEVGEQMIQTLKNKKHDAYLVESKEEVIKLIKEIVPEKSSAAIGGSITLQETGIIDFLKNNDYDFYNRNDAETDEEKRKMFMKAFDVDFFFCSANAITKDGMIVQLDGNGTRVAPMIWGPKSVIMVVGMNKIVPDLKAADERIKEISPMNAKRLDTKTPCVRFGECIDCESRERICVHHTILQTGVRHPGRFKIILVTEDLGL
jgi:L-lactate utilization protein LutB